MKKSIWIRLVALLLAIASVVTLVGCAGKVTEEKPDDTADKDTQDVEKALSDEQKNAIAMLYHLATITEEICVGKDNRVMLEEIYSALNNDINPGAIDQRTQDQLDNIRSVIEKFLNLKFRREKLQYEYNVRKAANIKAAIPDPLTVLSLTQSLDWRQLAINTVYTVVKSYTDYKSAEELSAQEYFLSNWELTEEQETVVRQNRNLYFNYMTEIVREYGSKEEQLEFGKLTLNQEAVTTFVEICAIEELHRKISRLEAKEDIYKLYGNYWLELADAYFSANDIQNNYAKCLDCIEQYYALDIQIFRKDSNIVPLLPKAIVAAQSVYSGDDYITVAQRFIDAIIANTTDTDWSVRYFAAQTYLDLYAKTNNTEYLQAAYDITKEIFDYLVGFQQDLNKAYLAPVESVSLDKNEVSKLSEAEKEAKEASVKAYNDALVASRAVELPPLYEPLVLTCDLLFALIEQLNIEPSDKNSIASILQTASHGVFLSVPVNNKYSFNPVEISCSAEINTKEFTVPAVFLVPGATVTMTVIAGEKTSVFDDFKIESVSRNGDDKNIDNFIATYTSEKMQAYKWSADAAIVVEIANAGFGEPIKLNFEVTDYKDNWIFPDEVTFKQL